MRRLLFRLLLILVLTPAVAVLALRWLDPPTSSVMLQQQIAIGTGDDAGREIDYRWIPIEQMGRHLPLAVVASEDQLFPRHMGFDMDAIQTVLENRGSGSPLRGASTLSQQVAKNLFLWQGRSWLRKGLEAGFTLLLESLWPKRRILEVYLNIAEWAPDRYGAAAASDYWFGRVPGQLDRTQAASMAAILPSPRRWKAQPAGPYVKKRRRWIERQMRQLGDDWLEGILP